MRYFRFIFTLLAFVTLPTLGLEQDMPYLRMVTNGYAVIASPSSDITLEPMTDTQRLITPHLLVESDLLVEQIQVKYLVNGQKKLRSILLTQRAAQPFIRFSVLERHLIDNAEKVTIGMETNIPERVIESYAVKLNGQSVSLSPDNTYSFIAYQPVTVIEGEMMISNSQVPVTGRTILNHAIQPDVGCDLVDENKRFYALCFANQEGRQFAQFYWNGQPIGHDGEVGYIPDMVQDLKLVFTVGVKRYAFNIIEGEQGYSLALTEPPSINLPSNP